MPQSEWVLIGINVAVVIGAVAAGFVVHAVLYTALKRFAARSRSVLDDSIANHCFPPLKLIFPLLALDIVLPSLKIPPAVDEPVRHVIALLLIAGIAWLIVRITNVAEDLLVHKFRIDVRDNLKARQIRTQFEVFRRVVTFGVFVIALGIALTTFEWAKTIGASVLASAGIVGLAASLAARPTIENLVAGLQIALTEPFRIEDVVIAENEWGWIEEINTTYVVVRTWDLRRVMLPLNYFIKTPFQNWTYRTSDLLAYVYLYLDYTMPIEPLRSEFTRILENSPLWDKKVNALQVSDATEHTIQVRALTSASDSGKAWDLRCEVREKLLEFVQRNYPQCLPRNRNELPEIRAHLETGNGNSHRHPGSPEP